MAKIWGLPQLQGVKSWEDLRRFTTQSLTSITDALTGKLTFQDNFKSRFVTVGPAGYAKYTWDSSVIPMVTIPHGLGTSNVGFILIYTDGAGVIWIPGSFPPDEKNIYLVTDNTNMICKMFLVTY